MYFVGMCVDDGRPLHSCEVARYDPGVEGGRVFRAAVWDKVVLDRVHDWRVPRELHSWELGRDVGVGDVIFLDEFLRGLIDFVVPFEQNAAAVGKVKRVRCRPGVGVAFDLRDHGVWHRVARKVPTLDFLPRDQTEELVCALQVSSGSEHDRGRRTRRHVIRWRGLVVGFAVGTKRSFAVFLEVELMA